MVGLLVFSVCGAHCVGCSDVKMDGVARLFDVGLDAQERYGWIAMEACNPVSLTSLAQDYTRCVYA